MREPRDVEENKEYYKKIPQIDPTDVAIETEGHKIKVHIDNDISFCILRLKHTIKLLLLLH